MIDWSKLEPRSLDEDVKSIRLSGLTEKQAEQALHLGGAPMGAALGDLIPTRGGRGRAQVTPPTYTVEIPLDEFGYPKIAVCCGGVLFTKDWTCECPKSPSVLGKL